MKKVLLLMFAICIAAFTLTGCQTDPYYQAAKSVYIGGKEIVIANADKLDEETLDKLEKLDEYASRYDEGRTIVKDTVDNIKDKRD